MENLRGLFTLLGSIVKEVIAALETVVELRKAPRADTLNLGVDGVEGKLFRLC